MCRAMVVLAMTIFLLFEFSSAFVCTESDVFSGFATRNCTDRSNYKGQEFFGCATFKLKHVDQIHRSCATALFCQSPGCHTGLEAGGLQFDWLCCCTSDNCNHEFSLANREFFPSTSLAPPAPPSHPPSPPNLTQIDHSTSSQQLLGQQPIRRH
uniref:Uncharacterized protein n=1 Tax=Acrobeloides nanus TaxID=290746 RepID=A0A914DZR0_9BILA